tara:strand:+ start:224 stop:649 length:426 start_codon:yes stop_codon:yes gene_type:complete
MASELRVDTLKDSSGNNSVATSVIYEGTNKAWAIIDTNTATSATTDSNNVSSVTDNGTGDFTLAWSSSMNATPYPFTNGVQNTAGDSFTRVIGVRSTGFTETTPGGMTTSNCRFVSIYSGSGGSGAGYQGYSCINIQGDLA